MQVISAVGLVFILAVLGILQVRQFDQTRDLRQRANQSYETRTQIIRFLSLHQDLETGQRGFVLTGDPSFLEPFRNARARLGPELRALRASTQAEPNLNEALTELEDLSQRKLRFSDQVVRLREQGRGEDAARLVATGQGNQVMNRLRIVIEKMDATERQDVETITARADASRTQMQRLTYALEAALLALLLAALWAINHNFAVTRRTAERLRDLSARQEAIFDAATDGMIMHDEHGVIETLNPAAARMYGYSSTELVGRHIGMLFESPPEQAELEAYLRRLANSPKAKAGRIQEFGGKRIDGSLFSLDVATSPVPLADGLRFLAVMRDVTERKRVDRLKTEFVSTVSHELRTPLTSIAGSLGLLSGGAGGALPERAARLIKIAHANSERLVRLINDILDIEKIESGKMSFDIRPVPLRPLVEQALQANAAYAHEYGVELRIAPGGDSASAMTDADRLMQVLTNLLSNAAKFSPARTEVLVTIVAGEKMHRLTVKDEGPGIPDEFRNRIFSKFAQADSSDTRQKGGTGLGLSIVKEIVTGIGGTISFDTEEVGTSFHVDLPAAPGLAVVEMPEQAPKRRILICHDDPQAAAGIKRKLEQAGLDSDIAGSAPEVRALTAATTYAAILLDLALPGEESIGLIRYLRSDPRYASAPILIAAPGASGNEISQALAIVDWFHKPVSAERLIDGIGDALPGEDQPCILHVEDDPDVSRVVASAFEGRARLDSVLDLEAARAALKSRRYDLVILDLALPGGSGLELLPDMLRDDGMPIPVVIFSAQDDDPETARRVEAMLTKSRASLNDLVGTVEAVLPRALSEKEQ